MIDLRDILYATTFFEALDEQYDNRDNIYNRIHNYWSMDRLVNFYEKSTLINQKYSLMLRNNSNNRNDIFITKSGNKYRVKYVPVMIHNDNEFRWIWNYTVADDNKIILDFVKKIQSYNELEEVGFFHHSTQLDVENFTRYEHFYMLLFSYFMDGVGFFKMDGVNGMVFHIILEIENIKTDKINEYEEIHAYSMLKTFTKMSKKFEDDHIFKDIVKYYDKETFNEFVNTTIKFNPCNAIITIENNVPDPIKHTFKTKDGTFYNIVSKFIAVLANHKTLSWRWFFEDYIDNETEELIKKIKSNSMLKKFGLSEKNINLNDVNTQHEWLYMLIFGYLMKAKGFFKFCHNKDNHDIIFFSVIKSIEKN